ncbi:MAG: hypothetical protein IJC99_00685 [Clostridia bacterium]|nr:hypothetical protein [Clostridia bacterium]
MSETEKKKRDSYRKRRRIAITVLALLLALVTLVTAAFGVLLYQLNKTLYIDYTEDGKVNYTVSLKPNDFYETDTLPAGQSYVASLINSITADFSYALQTEARDVDYEYSYWLDTQLLITDKSTGAAIYAPTFPAKNKQTLTQNSTSKLVIREKMTLDYAHYNTIAESFIKTYDLSNVQSVVIARMHVSVLSVSDDFKQNAQNEYVITLNIPLAVKTTYMEMSSTVPSTENKILACENQFNRALFVGAITGGITADVLLLLALILVTFLTRNTDITYAIKVKKLVNAYRSFIQQITNPFDMSAYQVLHIGTFHEMLEIRDTINSPVLMYENEDKTCTQFIIPTNTNLLYIFELKVANYDELYGTPAPSTTAPDFEDAPVFESVPVVSTEPVVEEEPPVTENLIAEEEPAFADAPQEAPAPREAMDVAIPVTAPIAEEIPDEEAAGFGFGPKYDYSFEARLALADDETKGYWRAIVTFARSFGVKVARSWARERIYLGRNLFAIITFKGKKLALAFAKDPATADDKYHAMDMSAFKKFERTPMLMRISSPRKLKFATELLTELFLAANLTDKKLGVKVDYADHRTKAELLAVGLIKIEGAPAPVIVPAVEPNSPASTPSPVPAPIPAAEEVDTTPVAEEIPDEEAAAFGFGPKYDYSFEARLALADDETKGYWRAVVTFARSFGVKVARSWARERIYLGRNLFAIITFKGKKLALAFAKDPTTADDKYHAMDMSAFKKFERTPMLMRISSPRKLKFATELLTELFLAANLTDKKLGVKVDYADHRTKAELLADGLIRLENQ